jgi:micrococcal nuclease
VLDGDSVRVTLDGESTEVRLLGINAPERDECWSQDSRDALILATTGSEFGLIGSEQDRFGRLLAYLYADGENLNEQQVSSGNAIALANDHDLLPDFLAAEEEAAALELGMWNPTACGPERTATGVRIWAIEPDAPGRDDRNPNGEFVSLTNDAAAADLSGWILRDESSQHRYTFPDGFVLDEGQIITVRSGCGNDTIEELYWCADGTVWTNSGDTVLLLDASGSIVERQRYSGG